MRKPLGDRLEYAILGIVMRFSNGTHQDSWGRWEQEVRRAVPDNPRSTELRTDLKSAFRRLWSEGFLRLSKPDLIRRDASVYSGDEMDDESFFFVGSFNATITDEGRSHWDHLNSTTGNGVFISHISQEKPVALVLQKYLKLAFGEDFMVFVSSDAKSIGGGRKWFTHIIEHLRMSEVVLVLVSQESKGREWINFEAGFGEGSESLVIPVAINKMSLGQLSQPLAGIQGRTGDDLGPILDDIGNRIGVTPNTIDIRAYLDDLQKAEAEVTYKSVVIEPVAEGAYLHFNISNVGNVDLELLMLEVLLPSEVEGVYYPFPGNGLDVSARFENNCRYKAYACYSARGAYKGITPLLRPILTPSMGVFRPMFNVPIRRPLTDAEKELSVSFQIHAVNYRTDVEKRRIADIIGWEK